MLKTLLAKGLKIRTSCIPTNTRAYRFLRSVGFVKYLQTENYIYMRLNEKKFRNNSIYKKIMNDFEEYVLKFIGCLGTKYRYASFDFCYSYFYQVHVLNESKNEDKNEDKEKSCMVLWSYLASWGMLRGSSKLLQKSPAYLLPLIDYIGEIYVEAIKIDVDNYEDVDDKGENNITKLIRFYKEIEQKLFDKDIDFIPSVTLVTKIMLGVFANVPAFDQYVKKAFGVNEFNEKSLKKIACVYDKDKIIIDKLANKQKVLVFPTLKDVELNYTRAKIVDMYGFQKGISVEINHS